MMRTVLYMALAVLFNASANFFIKLGMRRVEGGGVLEMLRKGTQQPALIAGVVLFGLALGAYSIVLTRMNLSVAYPTLVSIGLIVVVSASYVFLDEPIRPVQVAGFFLIIAGVWLVAR